MRFPCSTGELAQFLGVTEPQLSEAVRRGRIKPAPRVVAGRRLWTREQTRQAACALGVRYQPEVDDDTGSVKS